MKLSLETHSANIIHSYEAGKVVIRQHPAANNQFNNENQAQQEFRTLTGSVIITPELLIEEWLENAPDLTQTDLGRVLETNPEVILLGTGETLRFPDNQILQACFQANIGIEVMNTSAACRTYNVLAAEGRKVAVALMII